MFFDYITDAQIVAATLKGHTEVNYSDDGFYIVVFATDESLEGEVYKG